MITAHAALRVKVIGQGQWSVSSM